MEIDIVLKSHLLNLYSIALSDQEISATEMVFLRDLAQSRGIASMDLDRVLTSTTGKLEIPSTIEKKIEYLYDFARMSWADGEISIDERAMLKKFCQVFGFYEDNDALADYFLNAVKENVSVEQIIKNLNN